MQAKRDWTWAHKSYENPSAERHVAEPERIGAASDVVKLDTKTNIEMQSPWYATQKLNRTSEDWRKLGKNVWTGSNPQNVFHLYQFY